MSAYVRIVFRDRDEVPYEDEVLYALLNERDVKLQTSETSTLVFERDVIHSIEVEELDL